MVEKLPKVPCVFCNRSYTSRGFVRHFLSCKEKKLKDEAEAKLTKGANVKDNRVFLIKVFSPYEPQYWLIIEVNANVTLKKLDDFLRNIWLECCGHLSKFDIKGVSYEVLIDQEYMSYFGEKPRDMNIQLGKVLDTGLQFDYEYDFGSTTNLTLKVAGERAGQIPKNPIQLLVRNPEPVYDCVQCDNRKATLICAACGELYCESCGDEEHECGEEMFMPLVNSPRTGVCGYTG